MSHAAFSNTDVSLSVLAKTRGQDRHTRKPTRMPLRWPMKEALGMMMDVRTREANGVRYMGMLPKPKTLKLALPLTARIVIHLPVHT